MTPREVWTHSHVYIILKTDLFIALLVTFQRPFTDLAVDLNTLYYILEFIISVVLMTDLTDVRKYKAVERNGLYIEILIK